ncbi:hypothetical protein EXIGLDRAFT_732446 [Exidia glandulosa HHB12029]|uniref:Uncharacterized protein n=1 Tax=Exidia glandulosa HHB12029 TaxID=1314781 RepID=A0A165BII9_EXIGL|nr:hypothetical protein EXIGLDRAFT_732446 [Exidia glandulosa HHB12029]
MVHAARAHGHGQHCPALASLQHRGPIASLAMFDIGPDKLFPVFDDCTTRPCICRLGHATVVLRGSRRSGAVLLNTGDYTRAYHEDVVEVQR